MTPTTILPSAAILAKADQELTVLAQDRLASEALLDTVQGELHSVQARIQRLQSERVALTTSVQQAHSAYEKQHEYARLATDTPAEQTAVTKLAGLKKARDQADKH